MPPLFPKPSRILTRTQKRNISKRRAAKLLKASARVVDTVLLQNVSLTKDIASTRNYADAFAQNANVASIGKKIIQRTPDRVTSKMVDQLQEIRRTWLSNRRKQP